MTRLLYNWLNHSASHSLANATSGWKGGLEALIIVVLLLSLVTVAVVLALTLRRLRHLQTRARFLLDETNSIVYFKNIKQQYVYANRAFCQVNELGVQEILGKTDAELGTLKYQSARHSDEYVLKRGQRIEVVETLEQNNGYQQRVLRTLKFLLPAAHQGEQLLCSIANFESNQIVIEDPHESGLYDPLTKLPNRISLEISLEKHLSRVPASPAALFLISADNLKRINNTYGYSQGDDFLRFVTQRLRRLVNSSDILTRFDGNKFALLLTGHAALTPSAPGENCKEQLIALARQYKDNLEVPYLVEDSIHQGQISIGIYALQKSDRQTDEVVQNAYLALYQAQSQPKERLQYFDEQLSAQMRETLLLNEELPRAIERNQLNVVVHPQHDMSGALIGVELLMRWQHPTLGAISPNRFVPIAEKDNTIHLLGLWMLEQAQEFIQNNPFNSLSVSVNISPIQFHSPRFREIIQFLTDHAPQIANRLVIELTEGTLMQDVAEAKRIMLYLAQLGYRFSLDDFGTGYSNLAAISSFPLYEIKLDRSLVHHIDKDQHLRTIAQLVANLAHTLGLETVAEGVETKAELHALRELGFHHVQGFYFTRPMPLNKWQKFLKSARFPEHPLLAANEQPHK